MSEDFKSNVKTQVIAAMKAGEKVKLATLRGLLSALQYEEMKATNATLTETQSIAVTQTEIKKRKETLELLSGKAKDNEIDTLHLEISVLEKFLPQQMDKQTLTEHIELYLSGAQNKNVGGVMKHLAENYAGQFDPKMASEIAKTLLK